MYFFILFHTKLIIPIDSPRIRSFEGLRIRPTSSLADSLFENAIRRISLDLEWMVCSPITRCNFRSRFNDVNSNTYLKVSFIYRICSPASANHLKTLNLWRISSMFGNMLSCSYPVFLKICKAKVSSNKYYIGMHTEILHRVKHKWNEVKFYFFVL